jgi:hypothetical protein
MDLHTGAQKLKPSNMALSFLEKIEHFFDLVRNPLP